MSNYCELMIKSLLLAAIMIPTELSADTTSSTTYAQVKIATADGATYVVTGTFGSFIFKELSSGNFAYCMSMTGAIGLPPATNDTIFKDGFETIDICFQE